MNIVLVLGVSVAPFMITSIQLSSWELIIDEAHWIGVLNKALIHTL